MEIEDQNSNSNQNKTLTQALVSPEEKSTHRSENLKITLQGDEEDTITFENCSIELLNTRFFVETSENSSFHIFYWNCISIGKTKTSILIIISDVVRNEKIEQNPGILDNESEKSRDSIFEGISSQKERDIQLLGEYTLTIEEKNEKVLDDLFRFLNKMSSLCPDPIELVELLNPQNEDFGQIESFEGFQGGENWKEMMKEMNDFGNGNLGKREEIFDLSEEMERMRIEEEDDDEEEEDGVIFETEGRKRLKEE